MRTATSSEMKRLVDYNKKGHLDICNTSLKRVSKKPNILTYNINKSKIPINTNNKSMKQIAMTYFKINKKKHEPYLSQLFDLLYELTEN